ncbi:hypothetical protein K490DRAFT_46363 [Saccharata proteae CBS 121410]|uniref:DUF7728 domain-containing protein n=1 Tax=Saccharata proteae CBS 121410 TaxID=1314787 RepID=A0A9P4HS52_9PEZI|nr:hypothetical protein K490DRAFT_46363 [Saccharata proteae CBS 121410]
MKFDTVGLSATLALAARASAFLIPSTAEGIAEALPEAELGFIDPTNQIITVDCPGCEFAGSQDEDLVWVQGIQNSLLLNFSVGSDEHSVELNGVQLYPPPMPNEIQLIPVYQVRSDTPLTDIRSNIGKYTDKPLRISSYGVEIAPAATAASGVEVIPMTLILSALEGHDITVPALSIKLLKSPEGSLQILPISALPPPDKGPMDDENKECNDWRVLCKWRSIIADRVAAMKASLEKAKGGCMKGMKGAHGRPGGKPHHRPEGEGRPHSRPADIKDEDERPHHHPHRPHGVFRHHRQGPLSRFFHMVWRIMVPVMMGVAFGALVYVCGWMTGALIALVWIKVRGMRASRRGDYQSVALDEEDVEGKEAVEIPAEAPPVYMEKEVVSEEEH